MTGLSELNGLTISKVKFLKNTWKRWFSLWDVDFEALYYMGLFSGFIVALAMVSEVLSN